MAWLPHSIRLVTLSTQISIERKKKKKLQAHHHSSEIEAHVDNFRADSDLDSESLEVLHYALTALTQTYFQRIIELFVALHTREMF